MDQTELEILVYKIHVIMEFKCLWIFKLKRKIEYLLHYRISEDRFWFTVKINNKIIRSHHTKNNLPDSISLLEGIRKRLSIFQSILNCKFQVWNLRKENYPLYEEILNSGKKIDKPTIKGFFLSN